MALDPSYLDLRDKVAVVTGAASGIGQAIAFAYARFGADLALCDRQPEALAATCRQIEEDPDTGDARVISSLLDVRDAEAVDGFIDQVARHYGRIDILVNNAGGTFRADFADVKPKGQQALIDENFSSVTHFIRAALPQMPRADEALASSAAGEMDSGKALAARRSGPSIINITSIEAHRAGPGFAIYSAMKAAVASLTQSLALELGDRNIRVNAIAPDVIPTPGTGDIEAATPLARRGHVDDVAGAALYLASSLSAFVTGTTLHVDGGNAAAGGWRRSDGGGFEL
jgi:3-oxoacyl-[acyl-carrier protein] reductase